LQPLRIAASSEPCLGALKISSFFILQQSFTLPGMFISDQIVVISKPL
jgi:hypothetical protein